VAALVAYCSGMEGAGTLPVLLLVCSSFLRQASAQGQRCEVPSDCKDEYNPYCSKWGYCISYNLFGEEGPGQSKGAVEDGTRGQCRDDKDCTPWAPSCSPLGYCRGGVQDGSFGSPTNPKAGGKQSKWIKANAKSGSARNEEYYGKIEDDNLRAHKKFRKDNPIFYEQIPVLLPRLREIEKNVYTPCTYCKEPLDGEDGGGGAAKSKGGKPRGGSRGKGSKKGGGSRRDRPRSSGGTKSKGNSNFLKEIAAGRIPGKPGKDYPTHSLSKFKGAKPAPPDKIPKNYPKNGGRKSGGGRRSGGGGAGGRKGGGNGGRKSGGGDCPGSMEQCIDVCPSEKRVYRSCVASCGRRCAKK